MRRLIRVRNTLLVLLSITISAPAQDSSGVKIVGRFRLEHGTFRGIAVVGSHLYVTDYWEGLYVLDISDLSHPTQIGYLGNLGNPNDIVVIGQVAFISNSYGIAAIEISEPANPTLIGSCGIQGVASEIDVNGNTVFVAARQGGVHIVDVQTPSQPVDIGQNNAADFMDNITVAGNYAYIAARRDGLVILDVSSLTMPREIGRCSIAGESYGVAVTGNYAYVTAQDSGLRIIDISNIETPHEVATYQTGYAAWDIKIVGDYAFIANGGSGLRVLNVSDPAHPREIGFYRTSSLAWFVSYGSNGLVFVCESLDLNTSLAIYDCSEALGVSSTSPFTPCSFTLSPPFPNPFNSRTTVNYTLSRAGVVKLGVYDPAGRLVANIPTPGWVEAGAHHFSWDAAGVPAGEYFFKLDAGGMTGVQKSALVRW